MAWPLARESPVVKRRRKGEGKHIYIYKEEGKEGVAQHGSLFFPQTMRLSSGISPLAGDEGRADVISDKFLIAFHRGPGLLSVSLGPFIPAIPCIGEESARNARKSACFAPL